MKTRKKTEIPHPITFHPDMIQKRQDTQRMSNNNR